MLKIDFKIINVKAVKNKLNNCLEVKKSTRNLYGVLLMIFCKNHI